MNAFRLKSELQYKTNVLDDMQIQLKELRQLHSSGVVMDNNHSKILEKVCKMNLKYVFN